MYWSLQLSYLVTLLLAVPAGALLVRVFIIQHDCGHGSFFASPRLNDWVGMLCSVFTLAPYASWRRAARRPSRGLEQPRQALFGQRHLLRLPDGRRISGAVAPAALSLPHPRHPIVAHVVLPPLVFLILYRLPFDTPKDWSRERRAVHALNGALLLLIFGLGLAVGFLPVLLVQLPVMVVGAIIGVWLFAVQHRFEDRNGRGNGNGVFTSAALEGSSVLKLPRILHWFHRQYRLSTTSITSPRESRTTACSAATMRSRRFGKDPRSPSARLNRRFGSRCGTKSAGAWCASRTLRPRRTLDKDRVRRRHRRVHVVFCPTRIGCAPPRLVAA